MWANAQRDGRPAEYRWRPVLNAAVWLTPTTRVPCSNTAKTRNPLKLAGVPQTNKRISAASGPTFTILWRHVKRYCCLTSFFPIVDMCRSCEDNSPTNLCDGAQMAIFVDFFCVPYLQRAASSTFQTCILNSHYRATPCVKVW